MKIRIYYISAAAFMTAVITGLLTAAPSPESLIVGRWQEVASEYEMKGKGDAVLERVGKTLLIHQTESWEFAPGNKLTLFRNGKSEVISWRLTGRAHVLLITHPKGISEHYNVTKLTRDTLELNFETDIQARGVAKLTFARAGVQ